MLRPSRQVVVVSSALLLGGAWAWLLGARAERRTIDAGFWFEPVSFHSTALGGPLTAQDLRTIASTASSEIVQAFAGLRIIVSDRRDAPYRVRVVQQLRDPRFRSHVEVAGASHATSRGGSGAVSFQFLAGGAIVYAPPGASRALLIAAIGRGIGRSAVHELAHQFLPTAPIHGADVRSYEYESASRCEHYCGIMHWDIAWPLLQKRFGDVDGSPDPRGSTN